MRSYNQACGLAKALDMVGDRWSILIVRELLIRGRCRYTDLKSGLPGIATNLLSERLRELEAAGVIARHEAPPPTPASLFVLTEAGRMLEPAIQALGKWGAAQMRDEDRRKPFLSHWMVMPLRAALSDCRPDDQPLKIALHADGEAIAVIAVGGKVDVEIAEVANPDALVAGPGQTILGFMLGKIGARDAEASGVRIEGDREVFLRLAPISLRDGAVANA
jgi:DNA-binding HxlR family transcriptional regulator